MKSFLRQVSAALAVACGVPALAALPQLPAGGPQTIVPTAAERQQIASALGLHDFAVQLLEIPPAPGDVLEFAVNLDGVDRRLALVRNSVLSADFQVIVDHGGGNYETVATPDVATYRGIALDDPSIEVAATWQERRISATVVDPDGIWHVVPASRACDELASSAHVVYSDKHLAQADGVCGTHDQPALSAAPSNDGDGGGAGPRGNPYRLTEIAFDADVEFYQNRGSISNVVTEAADIMNGVTLIYERDVGITYRISAVVVRIAEPDPYSSTNPDTLRASVRAEWNTNLSHIRRDTAHLLTGKDVDGNVIGQASIGKMCVTVDGITNGDSYGFSQARSQSQYARRVALTAHEIGHIWNATHCNEFADCAIMCATLGGCSGDVTRFSSSSIQQIVAHRNSNLACTTDSFECHRFHTVPGTFPSIPAAVNRTRACRELLFPVGGVHSGIQLLQIPAGSAPIEIRYLGLWSEGSIVLQP